MEQSPAALLTYSTANLGDDIQSLAAAQFLPDWQTLIDRDHLDGFPDSNGRRTSLICNGWWTHRVDTWPPPPQIRPLLISMHLFERPNVMGHFLSESLREFYAEHGPVGCRDMRTLRLFEVAGIDAYLSGCLTLTFPLYDGPRSNSVVFTDVLGPGGNRQVGDRRGNRWWRGLPEDIRKDAVFVTHRIDPATPPSKRLELAREALETYRQARLVITDRIHAALPAIAMGTPTLLIEPRSEPWRLGGMEDLVVVQDRARAIAGEWDVDWSAFVEAPRPTRLDKLAKQLSDRCERFVASHVDAGTS